MALIATLLCFNTTAVKARRAPLELRRSTRVYNGYTTTTTTMVINDDCEDDDDNDSLICWLYDHNV